MILIITAIAMVYGTYAYMTKTKDRTALTKKVKLMLMSDEELKALEEAQYQKELEEFENDDDF